MKSKILLSMMIFLISCFSLSARLIISNPAGGNWASPDSWLEGVVPSNIDEVVIVSDIIISSPVAVKSVLIKERASLTLNTKKDELVFISEKIEIQGELTIGDNSFLRVIEIIRGENAQIENRGIIEVGKCNN